MNPARAATVAVLLLLAAGGARAASCTFSVPELQFGVVTQLNPVPVDVQAAVTVQCTAETGDLSGLPATATVDYTVSLDAGSGGTMQARGMAGPGGTLGYNVYLDAGRSTVWGNGSNATGVASGVFTYTLAQTLAGAAQGRDHIAFGRIPPGINLAPGVYSDTLTARLEF